jgi:hypothetical protein
MSELSVFVARFGFGHCSVEAWRRSAPDSSLLYPFSTEVRARRCSARLSTLLPSSDHGFWSVYWNYSRNYDAFQNPHKVNDVIVCLFCEITYRVVTTKPISLHCPQP